MMRTVHPFVVCSAGSVIFSQSVLAIRSGVSSRLQGVTLGVAQAFIFLLPVSLVHLLPNFYYGALLAVLGIQICHEWLWNTRMRISRAEFVLSWASFISTLTLTSLMPVQVRLHLFSLVKLVACIVTFMLFHF
jgi:MFS superfamily sulfate permease-like transporter